MTDLEVGLSMLHLMSEPFNKMILQIPKAKTVNIEIVDDGLHTLDKQRVAALNSIRESCGLVFSLHAPFSDLNIASPSDMILRATLRRMQKSIEYANALETSVWVFHPGMKTGLSSFYPGKDWLRNLKTVKYLLRVAENYGVRIAIENVPEPFPFLMKSVADFTRFYDEIREDIGLVLDVGHSNINGETDLFLETFADRIVHIHVSDNDGKQDQHLGIGYGTVNWNNLAKHLKEMAYNRTVIIESIEHVEESMQKLKRIVSC